MQVLRGNFKIDLVPLFVSRGKNTGEESSFYRVEDYNADSCIILSFFLAFRIIGTSLSPFFFFFPLPRQPVVVPCFFPLFFSSPFDHYATPTQLPAFLPFPVINPSSRDPESGSKRFRRPDLKRQSLDTSVLRYLVYLPYIPIRSNCK